MSSLCQLHLPQQWSNLRLIGLFYEYLRYGPYWLGREESIMCEPTLDVDICVWCMGRQQGLLNGLLFYPHLGSYNVTFNRESNYRTSYNLRWMAFTLELPTLTTSLNWSQVSSKSMHAGYRPGGKFWGMNFETPLWSVGQHVSGRNQLWAPSEHILPSH